MIRVLKENEGPFLLPMEDSVVGLCIIQENRIIYKNSILKEILGPLPESFETNFFDHLHPDDVEKFKDMYRQITSGRRRTEDADVRFYPQDKKGDKAAPCWIQCRVSPINHQIENAFLLQITDITRIKEMENLLSVSQKMSSLGNVAAGIAHEIRNPLTGINSYLYTLEDLCNSKTIEGEQIETVKQIVRQFQVASDKIEAVVKRVLDFSRPNTPKMILIDINKCIENAVGFSAATLRKVDIQLETSLELNLPQCYGDAHLIEQVLLNLINNAAQAIKKNRRPKRIEIASYCKDNCLFIQVSDSGPGIAEELAHKVFDPFFTTHHDGSGIGLSIAQRIVADHYGTIEILKSKWGGATLSVKLPIEKRRNST